MVKLEPEYVLDKHQRRKAVLLPLAQWRRILSELEELEAIREYDKAKTGSQDSIPFEQAVTELQEG